MNDQHIEQQIQAKGLTAPRITPADIEANIASEHYFTAAEGVLGAYAERGGVHPVGGTPSQDTHNTLSLLTFCVLVLRNGFTVTGESACASQENFDAEIGRKIARANAINKVWPLMGYHLKQQLHEQQQALASIGAPESAAPHERRAAVELVELKARMDKLGDFIDNSDAFMSMPPQQQLLMARQHRAMTEYADALGARVLSTFTNDNA